MAVYNDMSWWSGALPVFAVIFAVIYYHWPWSRAEEVQEAQGVADLERPADETGKRPPSKPRLQYLDHVKVFVTIVVVVFHCTCVFDGSGAFGVNVYGTDALKGDWKQESEAFPPMSNAFLKYFGIWFETVNNAYFMGLFFFISGFFTPSSFERKGAHDFLRDKFKRYGIPVIFTYLIFQPVLYFVFCRFVGGQSWYFYGIHGTWISGGPCWFLLALLFFNTLYAFDNSEPLRIRAPSVGMLLAAGFVLGLVRVSFPTGGTVFGMPHGFQVLPQYTLFFYSGVMAKRGDWLASVADYPESSKWMMRILAIVLLVLHYMNIALRWSFQDLVDSWTAGVYWTVFEGFEGVVYSFVVLELSSKFLNRDLGPLMHALSTAAYPVYIIHPLVVNMVTWSWGLIMQATVEKAELTGGMKDADQSYPAFHRAGFQAVALVIQTAHFNELMFLGWAYVAVVSNLIVWPLAYCIKKIPKFDQVL
jgi:hypothetical protein